MMRGSAQLDFLAEEDGQRTEPQSSELRQQVAERLKAHRQRRAQPVAVEETPAGQKARGAKEKIAAAVAERYAQTPSYRAYLAEQARRATEEAAAVAEVARRNAEAVAAEQQRLLTELELWDAPQQFTPETAVVVQTVTAPAPPPAERQPEAAAEPAPTLTVRLYEDLGPSPSVPPRPAPAARPADCEETQALDEEIAFRQAPVFEHYSLDPPTPLPANLLEFPRQLVAARKARPLLAEGPLLEEAKARSQQLRIFEVEAELISPEPPPVANAPEWSSIRLEAHTASAAVESAATPALPALQPPQTAPLELRAMAAIVDSLLVFAALLGFAAIFVRVAGPIPAGVAAAGVAAVTYAAFFALYQLLFFSFNGQTPGMLYAHIGLCTFTDENPTRSAMRRRILAQAIALAPLGIGVLWALLDDEGLGWHDRISRMYLRAY
jgi:uncharacterized RDD family membrane protein YckC